MATYEITVSKVIVLDEVEDVKDLENQLEELTVHGWLPDGFDVKIRAKTKGKIYTTPARRAAVRHRAELDLLEKKYGL